MMNIQMNDTAWHTFQVEDTLRKLEANAQTGLSDEEADQRLQQYGPNELVEAPRPGFWRRLLAQFNNFVIYLLLFAAAASFALGDQIEALAIIAIVILNAALGVVQEGRAEGALSALRKLAAPHARVLRDGRTESVRAGQLVPGDIVLLEAGDYVPADLRLVETFNLKISEASFTGESAAVDKLAGAIVEASAVPGDRINMAYMGTLASYGRGKGVVVATGMKTEIGHITHLLQSTDEEETPLQKRLNDLGRSLSIAALVICGFVFVIGALQDLARGDDLIASIKDSFIIAISLAIAAVPEGLPAVVTINLAIGMREMLRRNALIRRLPSVETLGSATAICSDKTGTLTQNQMTAVRLYVAGHRVDVTGNGRAVQGDFRVADVEDPLKLTEVERVLMAGLLASDARLEPDRDSPGGYRLVGDPTEGALVGLAAKAGLWREAIEAQYPRVAEIPFDAERKRMSTVHRTPDGECCLVFVKGAPEIMIDLCDTIYENGESVAITPERRRNILSIHQRMATEALRVLAVAQRRLNGLPLEVDEATIECHLELLGLVALRDPARPEVDEAIDRARQAGIKTVMVTGDFPDTARAIAEEIGLLRDNGRILSGSDLEQMSDEALSAQINEVDVFARVSPHHKVRIVEAFRASNHVVAMTGDGVNDAPALKRASIGVAMGITGTDVSKESADMILTDDNYASIVAAVEQGRVIYSNIRKFVYYLLSCNVAEISVIFIATLFGWPTPLTAIQLLWLNLITDGAPALALGVEKGDPDMMKQPPRSPQEPIINRDMRIGIAVQTVVMTVVTLLAFAIGRGSIHLPFLALQPSDDLARVMAFVVLSASQLARAYSSRSERFSLFTIGVFSNRYMQYAVASSIVGLLLVIYIPFLQAIFDTLPLGVEHWLVIIPLLLIPTVVAELTKVYLRREQV